MALLLDDCDDGQFIPQNRLVMVKKYNPRRLCGRARLYGRIGRRLIWWVIVFESGQ